MKKAKEKKYRSRLDTVVKAERLTEKVTKKLKISEPEQVDICIAVTEAVNNAVEHGNKLINDKFVTLLFEYSDDKLRITVKDQGEGFDLESVENPLSPENLTKPNGRGLLIVESLMDDIEVSTSATGTKVVMLKKR